MTKQLNLGLFSFLMACLLILPFIWGIVPAQADECDDAKRALAYAQEDLEDIEVAFLEAYDAWDSNKGNEEAAKSELEEATRARQRAYREFRNAWDLAENARLAGSTNWDEFWNTKAWQAYQAAMAAHDQALDDFNRANDAETQAIENYESARAIGHSLEERLEDTFNAVIDQRGIVHEARERVEEACQSETPELDRLLDEFGMNNGSDVVEEYAGRARNANAEDIAIERARQLGLDGQGAGGGAGSGMGAGSPANFCAPGSAGCSTLNFKVVDSSQPGNSTSYQLGGTSVATGLSNTQEQAIVIGVPTGTPLTLSIACAGTNNAGALSCITSIVVNSGGSCTNNVTTTALGTTNTSTTCTGS